MVPADWLASAPPSPTRSAGSMNALDDEIRDGLAWQEAGNWEAALACYRRILARDPDHGPGLFHAGIAEARSGQLDSSRDLLNRCLVVRPDFAPAAQALGGVLLAQGNHAQAASAFEKALALGAASAAVCYDLGTACVALGQEARAADCFQRAAIAQPDFADAHNSLGFLRLKAGRLDDAVRSFEQAIGVSPSHARAWFNLGTARQLQENHPAAVAAYQRTLALAPNNPPAENNLGLLLRAEGRFAEALAAFRRAGALKPDDATIQVNLAAALQDQNQLADAIAVLEAVLARAPADCKALANLGNIHVALNQPAAGIALYERALAIDPNLPDVRYNIALAHLVLGELERGWAGYDARLETKRHRELHVFDRPRWHAGEPIAGRTVLVYAEQGLGDTIQFVRYVPLLVARGARVIVRVQSALQPLLALQAVAATFIAPADPLPDHDFQCPLLSLPREFATRLDSIPSPVPYLTAPPAKVAAWRKVFAHAGGLKVGLVWSGNPRHQFDYNRSVPFDLFAQIAAGIPAHFFAIQKELRGTDGVRLGATPHLTDLSGKLGNFADTAAVVTALDLVITVDTSVAHLAGALGTKTWVLLGYAPDWRWLLDRSDSPWYSSVRLFRQPAVGDWAPVIRAIRAELAALAR